MLERVSLFSSLSPPEIAALEAIAQKRTMVKNTVVISEGDETDSLYIVLSGKANAMRTDEAGRQVVVNRFGALDYFGEMSFFDGTPRCATVMTKTRCQVMIIPRREFLSLAQKNPAICWNVIQALLQKLRRATQQIEALAFLDVYGRLVRFFIENKDPKGVINEKLTQQELAEIVGTSRETVCRICSALMDGGYLSREKGRFVVLKELPYKF